MVTATGQFYVFMEVLMSNLLRYRCETLVFSAIVSAITMIIGSLTVNYTFYGDSQSGVLMMGWTLTTVFAVFSLFGFIECFRPGTFPNAKKALFNIESNHSNTTRASKKATKGRAGVI
jgi:hypothetical protein